jgi:hypothetical protein
MADVNIQSSPASSGGGAGAVIGVIVLVVLLVIGWFFFSRGGLHQTKDTKVEVNLPGAAPSGGAKKP